MADWKKIIVSGSQAELAGVTGSFTGSFFGDGSGLTGVSSFSVTGDVNNRVITADGTGGGVGETNLTFDGTRLIVTGVVVTTGAITGSALNLSAVPAGTDNSVLVVDANGNVVTDEIDSRVWGTTLVDGTSLAANQVTYATDVNSITGASSFTYTPGTSTLAVTNAIITGDLTVQGTTTELQVTNLNIQDQFILLNSGSTTGDTGILFGGSGGSANSGSALYFDSTAERLVYNATSVGSNATALDHVAGGYVTIAYDVNAGQTPVDLLGNLKVEDGEPYIYI
jgi:hypothetical protein